MERDSRTVRKALCCDEHILLANLDTPWPAFLPYFPEKHAVSSDSGECYSPASTSSYDALMKEG